MSANTEAEKRFEQLSELEQELIFERFSRSDALEAGLKAIELGESYADPIAVEITMDGLAVFRHLTEGTGTVNEEWLERKRNSVELTKISSLRFKTELEIKGETLEDRVPDPDLYAAGGGGFPIVLKDQGMVGVICISGLPNDVDDHQIAIDALRYVKSRM